MNNTNGIESTVYYLLQNEPFFAHFLLASKVSYNNPKIERAACSFHQNQVVFYFNLDWFNTISLSQRAAVLKHEIFHVMLDHVGNRMYGSVNMQAKNIAMDCAINQFIHDLPGNCVTLKSVSELCKRDLLPYETWEYYYHQLKNEAENNGQKHDHDVMHEGDGSEEGEISDLDRSMRGAIIKDRIQKSVKSAAGNIPDGVGQILAELNKSGKVNWKQQLRNLIFSSKVVQTKPSRLKVHRRFELDQPGRKKDRKLVLGVCVDSSGSINDDQFKSFMTEVYNISKMTSITYLVHADSEVQKVETIRGGKAKTGVLTSRHGNGGTAYQPAISQCAKLGCDAIVYFGDFDTSDTPTNPGVPFIWVGVGNQEPPASFGKVIRI